MKRLLSLVAVIAALVGIGSCGSNSPGTPNGLSCTVSPTSGEAPLIVTFSATGKESNPNDYHWNFSDGTAASGQSISRTLSAGGTFSGRVSITSTGESCETQKVVVGAPIRLACFADPSQLIIPGEVHFRAEPAGGDGTFTYVWDFGDGSKSTEQNPVHPYHQAGTYPTKVTATSTGLSATCMTSVQTFDGGLEVSCSADPTEGEAPLKVNFRAEASGGSGTYDYLWAFGPNSSSTSKNATHTYNDHGIFEATVTVHTADRAGKCTQTIYVNRTVVCGDFFIEPGEKCDDGNTASGDGCDSTCSTVEHGFTCTGAVQSHCKSTCGDGLVASDEECDQGNKTNGDGCDSKCKVETGFTCTGEPSVCI